MPPPEMIEVAHRVYAYVQPDGSWMINNTVPVLEPDVLVPGHGPVCRGDEVPRLLDDLTAYATFVDEVARESHAAGRSPREAARRHADTPFAAWQESECLVGNLHRAYSELDGHPGGTPLPLADIWPDMIAFHGGLIGCVA